MDALYSWGDWSGGIRHHMAVDALVPILGCPVHYASETSHVRGVAGGQNQERECAYSLPSQRGEVRSRLPAMILRIILQASGRGSMYSERGTVHALCE